MRERRGNLTWVHFGDLHLREREHENYLDFLELIQEANENLKAGVDFAFLPGDNAEDGIDDQYRLVRDALSGLRMPVHIITGDHDRKSGSLAGFQDYLQPRLYRKVTAGNFQLLFLNAMDGSDKVTFDLAQEQWNWLQKELAETNQSGPRPLVFVHLYPSELKTRGRDFSHVLRNQGVELVEMGHTHYNELANDGQIIYAATRSTGQIEEGPPGFSMTVIDDDVVSWKFKPRRAWPFVMISSPADYRLITKPDSPRQVIRGPLKVRAKAWDGRGIQRVTLCVDDGRPEPMHVENGSWQAAWDPRAHDDGIHVLRVAAETPDGHRGHDQIWALVKRAGTFSAPPRSPIDYENAIGPWPEKGILGTQLGPNENGTKGPWPSWRVMAQGL